MQYPKAIGLDIRPGLKPSTLPLEPQVTPRPSPDGPKSPPEAGCIDWGGMGKSRAGHMANSSGNRAPRRRARCVGSLARPIGMTTNVLVEGGQIGDVASTGGRKSLNSSGCGDVRAPRVPACATIAIGPVCEMERERGWRDTSCG